MSTPSRRPSSRSSALVKAACAGPRRPSTTTSRMRLSRSASSAWSATSVRSSSSTLSVSMRATSAATLPLPITTARSAERSNSSVAVVRVAVVPGHEVRGGPAARQVLPGDPQRLVGLGPGGVDHGRVVVHELGVRDVAADLHVAEEAAAALERLGVERRLQPLDLLVVGRHPAAQQPPRRGQPLEQVDLGVAVGPQQAGGGERPGGPGADDRHPRPRGRHQAAVRSIVLRPAKNCAFSSSA